MNLRYHSREVVENESSDLFPGQFHQREVLPRRFEKERWAAQKAKLRVSQRLRTQRLQQQQEKERERLGRWYNQNPSLTSKSKRVIDGQKVAKSRIKKHQKAERTKEKKMQKEKQKRWYTERIKSNNAETEFEAQDYTRSRIEMNAKSILDRQRQEKLNEEKRKRKLKEEKQKRIQRVLGEAKENLQKSVKIDLEEMIIRKQLPPFRPGPYLNNVESTYGREEIAVSRRTFAATEQQQLLILTRKSCKNEQH